MSGRVHDVVVVSSGALLSAAVRRLRSYGLDVLVVDESLTQVWAVETDDARVAVYVAVDGVPARIHSARILLLAHVAETDDGRPRPPSALARSLGVRAVLDAVAGGWVVGRAPADRVRAGGPVTGVHGARAGRADVVVAADALALGLTGRRAGPAVRARRGVAAVLARWSRRRTAARWRAADAAAAAAAPDTVVCPCEGLTLDDVSTALDHAGAATTLRELKLATRLGMGACQGRTCGPRVALWAQATGRGDRLTGELRPRVPVVPLTLAPTPPPTDHEE